MQQKVLLFTFGTIYIVTTVLLALFIKEHDLHSSGDSKNIKKISLKSTYLKIWKMIQIIPIRKMMAILLTMKVNPWKYNKYILLKL